MRIPVSLVYMETVRFPSTFICWFSLYSKSCYNGNKLFLQITRYSLHLMYLRSITDSITDKGKAKAED
jgi:hypothetical protein